MPELLSVTERDILRRLDAPNVTGSAAELGADADTLRAMVLRGLIRTLAKDCYLIMPKGRQAIRGGQ